MALGPKTNQALMYNLGISLASAAQAQNLGGAQLSAIHAQMLGMSPAMAQIQSLNKGPETPIFRLAPALWVGGWYILAVANGKFVIDYKKETIAAFNYLPSRNTIARVILDHRRTLPLVNARDIDGSLLGIRVFMLNDALQIISPTQFTIWKTEQLAVQSWDESAVVRGVAGIHAAWPARSTYTYPAIDHPTGEHCYLADVRGFGKVVKGITGWRAERCIIDRFYLTKQWFDRPQRRYLQTLVANYPNIEFLEEPWTSEKSLRSLRFTRKSSQPTPRK